jgi:ParB family chromosome partitioning protein
VFFPAWDRLHAVHYCADPTGHGHAVRSLLLRPADSAAPGADASDVLPDPPVEDPPDPDRKLVIEGNKAWRAASEVRKRWLANVLFVRRTAPREAAPFIARQLLTMPDPLRTGLAAAVGLLLFREITGRKAADWLEACDTTPAGRVPLLMLGPVVTAYEQAMTEGEGKNTWRTDRYSPCPRRSAGTYLAFLAGIGYELSAIEQALVDDVPYTGDTPADPDLADSPATATGDEAAEQTDTAADDGSGGHPAPSEAA